MSKAFGEQNPNQGETAVSWGTWSDGMGISPTVEGDEDWGKLKLDLSGEEGRSAVYDLGSIVTRTFVITENRYGTGEESATLQIRTSTTAFLQDDILPVWVDYSVPLSVSCRYVQIRETTLNSKIYFVDATGGDDGNDGLSEAGAWQTIAKVNAVTLNPGDCVLFKRGETFSGKLVPALSGTLSNPIIYSAYGTGNLPIIDGSADCALYIGSTIHYLRYENIDFSGSIGSTYGTVTCQSSHHYFYNCTFRDSVACYGFNGYDWNANGSVVHNVVIDSCIARNNYKSGIEFGSTNGSQGPHDIFIYNTEAYENGTSAWEDHGIYARHGVTIDRCIAHDNPVGSGIKVNCQGVHTSPYKPQVSNCISYDNYIGFVLDNIDTPFFNNLTYGNTMDALNISTDSDGCLVYHNTFINSTSAADCLLRFEGVPTGLILKDNIFVQDSAVANLCLMRVAGAFTLEDVVAAVTFDHNVYYHDATGSGGMQIRITGYKSR